MRSRLELLFDQISVLTAKDFKLKYNSTVLGYLWSILTPVSQSIVYYFVFRVIIRFEIENYLLFLLSGMFLWQFFCNSVLVGGNVFWGNVVLIKKTSLSRSLLLFGSVFTEFLHFALTIPILLALMFVYHVPFGFSLFLLPLALFSLVLFTLGFSFLYATVNMWFRDMERIMGVLLQMWVFLSPVMIPMSIVPEKYHILFKCNPMYYILNFWRDIFYQPHFSIENMLFSIVVSVVVFIIGFWIFQKKQSLFSEMM